MKRKVDLNEISDGRLYSSGDMVKVDCHDCEGCSACCQGMGNSILLDPMDLWRLQELCYCSRLVNIIYNVKWKVVDEQGRAMIV